MNTLYFFAMLVGVAWLMLWSSLPRPYHGGGWWPFDVVDDDPDPKDVHHRDGAAVKADPIAAGDFSSSWRARAEDQCKTTVEKRRFLPSKSHPQTRGAPRGDGPHA